jgi:hypothetical protein
MRMLASYLRPMLRPIVVFAALASLTMLLGCAKETTSSDDSEAAYIAFAVDTGYAYQDMAADTSDTLHVRMTATRGTDPIVRFRLNVAYDGGAAVTTDSLVIESSPFVFERDLVTRGQAGSEKWTFTVWENDGDRTIRSFTLSVQ